MAENNVSGFNYESEIFPVTAFLSNDSCAAVSDARITFYSGKEIPQSSSETEFTNEVAGVYTGGSYVGVLFRDDTSEETQYSLQIYDGSGNVTGTIDFTMDYSDIQIAGRNIYINNASELQIYSVSGRQRYDGTFDEEIREVVPRSDELSKLYVVTESGLQQMMLR